MWRISTTIFCLLSISSAFAKSIVWTPQPDSRIAIKLKYTLGTHDLKFEKLEGSLAQEGASPESYDSIRGELRVPIRSIQDGSPKMNCHMFEALGLDYEKSGFPEAHVCDSKHRLPESGNDRVVYPDIVLTVKGLKHVEHFKHEVIGDWTIHGVTRPARDFFIEIEPGPDGALIKGKYKFTLKDFGIVVKKALVISVGDFATADFEIKFARD